MPRLDVGSFFGQARERVSDFHERHALRWEVAMSVLAVAFLALGLVADGKWDGPTGWIATTVTAVFVAEYVLRLAIAPNRVNFVRTHPVELAALVPLLRGLRVLALIWVAWLRPMALGLRELARRRREREPAVRPRPWLPIAWALLLLSTAVATYGYASGGGVAGREPQFAVLVMVLATFSGLTASLATWYSRGSRVGLDETSARLLVLKELSDSGQISPSEFGRRRDALLGGGVRYPHAQSHTQSVETITPTTVNSPAATTPSRGA